jgi:two-component system OmpR family sensor kinase
MALAVLGGWTAAGTAFVVDGARHRSAPRLRLGLGLGVLAFAQLPRIVSAPLGIATGNVVSAVVSLAGLGVVLIALTQLVLRALGDLRAEQWQQEEDLAAAALSVELVAELAAERDHELRNGLAGLAGITHLLSAEKDSAENANIDHVRLEHAVLSELSRLHMILAGGGIEPDGHDQLGPETDYLVEPVLAGLVTLRRSGGERLQLHVEPGLLARGRSAALAQVITNLLSNCDRHAPGVPVTVAARTGSDGVIVEVRDTGPGLAKGAEDDVLDRGVHDESGGGSGLGLHISRRLVTREGGSLTLRTLGSPRGCLATVTVPLGDASGQRSPPLSPTVVPFIRRSHHPSHPASAAVRTAFPPVGKPSNR